MKPASALAPLLVVAREASFLKGSRLVRQGEASRGAFLIRTGNAEASVALPGGGTLAVAQFGPDDMFGEMALIERGIVTATVVARSNVDGWFIGRDDFRALVASRDRSALGVQCTITGVLASRLRALNDKIKGHPAVEDHAAVAVAPEGDPLAKVPRSRQASFNWREFLPILPFFDSFDEGEIDDFAAGCKVMELQRGDWVFTSGVPATACYLVLRGALEVFTRDGGKDRRVAIAGPGELVGFMAVIGSASRANNARVREGCALLEVPARAFMDLYHGDSGTTVSLHHAIHRALMRSIARTNTQLTRLISHARLAESGRKATELEQALHGQLWRAEAGVEQ